MLVSRRVKTLVQSWDFYSCQSGDATYRLPGAEGLDAFCATARRDGDNFAVKVLMGDGDLGGVIPTVDGSEIPNKEPPTGMVWKPDGNNWISTVSTSTGEFTGFLNHQQWCQ